MTVHRLYRALGRKADERQREYRLRFRVPLETSFMEALRYATNGGWAMGDGCFRSEIAKALKRRVTPLPPGPRSKSSADNRQIALL